MLKKLCLALVCLALAAGSAAWLLRDGTPQAAVQPTEPSAPVQPPAPPPDPQAAARQARDRAVQAALDRMTPSERVGQLIWARCPADGGPELVQQYAPAGFVLFGPDFKGRTADEVRDTVADFQAASAVPLLIGTDEEGGTVVRASRYLRETPYRAPQQVYAAGGLDAVAADTADKDAFLHSLGINVNLAPVADVSTDPADFIYARAFGQDADATAAYVKTVVTVMGEDRMGAVLKHFPGYGPNADTHTGGARDTRPAENLRTCDLIPFAAGIQAGAGAVLVSHNTVEAFDPTRPASLSPAVYAVLRGELGFEGVAVTDDLAMQAVADVPDAAVQAVLAGCDLVLSSDLPGDHAALLDAVQQGRLPKTQVDAAVRRVLGWKYDLGLLD